MNSWLEFEVRFRELIKPLSFLRLSIQTGSSGEYWSLTGMGRSQELIQFELLIEACCRYLEQCLDGKTPLGQFILSESDPKIRWYKTLKELSGQFKLQFPAYEKDDGGNHIGTILMGDITQVVEASANLCLKLHVEYPIQNKRNIFKSIYNDYGKEILIGIILIILSLIATKYFG